VPPHRRLDQDLVDRLPFVQVFPSRWSKIYHNLCDNRLGGSLNWRHRGPTILKERWSDLVDGFGKADTKCGSDTSEEIHECLSPSLGTGGRTCCPRPRTFVIAQGQYGQSGL